MDHAALRTEIAKDPTGLGYAASLATGSDAGLPALLNAPTPALINIGKIARPDFVFDFAFIILRIISLPSPALVAKWQWYLDVLSGSDFVDMAGATVLAARAQAITDGLCTAAEWDSVALRPGSRAEILFGPGTIITHADIAQAMAI